MKSIIILIFFAFANLNMQAQLSGQERLDSLIAEIPNAKSDTNHVMLNYQLSKMYYQFDQTKGIEFGLQGVKLAEMLDWKYGASENMYIVGVNFHFKAESDSALFYFNKSWEIKKELKDKSGIANCISSIGMVLIGQSQFPEALDYYLQSLTIIEELGNNKNIAKGYSNIGTIYKRLYDYDKALEYFNKALNINIKNDYKSEIANNYAKIGVVYGIMKKPYKALEYHRKALAINIEIDHEDYIATNYNNIGIIYEDLKQYSKALEYHKQALELNKKLGQKKSIAYSYDNIGLIYFHLGNENSKNIETSISYLKKSILLLHELGAKSELVEVFSHLRDAYVRKGDYHSALEYADSSFFMKDSIFNLRNERMIANLTSVREKEVAEKETEILLQKNKVSEIELAKNKIQIYASVLGLIFLSIFGIVIFRQRQKSENLLLNILPQKIADRLKKKEKPIADYFDSVSIVFMDMVSFTEYSKSVSPHELVGLLNKIFIIFDEIAQKYGLEKIKTIGDCYMAVCGIPEPNPKHAENVMNFAIEANKSLENIKMGSGEAVKFRTGVESGPVVAGVIGSNKFIYDLWGEAVNTASRMESHGMTGKIQMTDNFKNELEKHSKIKYDFQERGEIEIKGGIKINAWYL